MIDNKTIIKKEDGTEYLISVELYLNSWGNTSADYSTSIRYRLKGKRKWLNIDRFHESQVTNEDLYQAKLNFWEKLKPTI